VARVSSPEVALSGTMGHNPAMRRLPGRGSPRSQRDKSHHSHRLPAVVAALVLLPAAATGALIAGPECAGISETTGDALTTVRIASGLLRPIFVTSPPGDLERLFVAQQDGSIRLIRNGALLTGDFLSIPADVRSPADPGGGREEGLLGLAFHPGYTDNGWFFIYHTRNDGSNVVARYTRSANHDAADPNSRQEVIVLAHPGAGNHNGGMIAFGSEDGYLYIGTGDGGGSCDPNGRAQDLLSHQGKLLRIDVDALPYSIPPDNPWSPANDPADAGNDEIWALGLRNPWRWSFAGPAAPDPQAIYIGDVGQNQIEEVSWSPGGAGGDNYGWDVYEGATCPAPSCGAIPFCSLPQYVAPLVTYPTNTGCAVTGGYAYHGCRMPDLHGRYFYSDYCSAFIKSFRVSGGMAVEPEDNTTELDPPGPLSIRTIASYGVDARGEIHLVDYDEFGALDGEIFKIVPILPNLEVSGRGAQPLAAGEATGWTWENLTMTSSHPIAAYRVYRHEGRGNGVFACVHHTASTGWIGDDPAPPPGQIRAYLVTAVNAAGQSTTPGAGTGGAPRALSPAACP